VGGLELYSQRWLPEREPRAAIMLVHGVGEHSGRYMRVVEPLVDAGYAVHTYDQRGHGRSEGRRVHISRWSEYRDDLATCIGMASEHAPGRPMVLYGHSMGSLVVLDYLLTRRDGLAGAIISGIATEPTGVGSPALIALARALSGVLPTFSVDLGIDASALSCDPGVAAAYSADPLVTGRATVRWATEGLDTVERVKSGLGSFDLPLLVLHGGADPLDDPAGARALYDAAPNADKTLRIYPDARHEPHNDLCHEQFAADISAWLDHLADE
jgi:alpha-beta hydrolase superfamily lysophospholipase